MKKERIKNLISVIVVTYKQEKYLYETIDTILFQDYPYIELIIADDGTPDFDSDKIKKYIKGHAKLNLIKFSILFDGVNRGTVKNINRALKASSGEYIKLIGGDDTYVNKSVFSKEINMIFENKNLYGVVAKTHQCDAYMNQITDERVEKSNYYLKTVLAMNYKESRKFIARNDIFPIAIQSSCFRWTFFDEMGLCDEDYIVIDDSPTILKILQKHNRFVYLDDYSINHRSDVGISTSRELFSVRRLIYYLDCVTYGKKEIRPNGKVYGLLYSYFIPKVNEYVYKMALSKSQQKNLIVRIYLTIKFFFPLSYYFLLNSKKVILRIKKSNS